MKNFTLALRTSPLDAERYYISRIRSPHPLPVQFYTLALQMYDAQNKVAGVVAVR